MATTTYIPIYTTTLTSNESTVSFSSFGGYTDLRVVANIKLTGTNGLYFKPNSDSSSVYSATTLYGNGSSTTSSRLTTGDLGGTGMYIPGGTFSTSTFSVLQIDFMNYTNTNVYKTALVRYSTSDARVGTSVELFAKTDAITSLVFGCDGGGSIAAGSTFTLYGIANAGDDSPKANGGDVYSDSSYWYHVFPMSGNFIPNQSITTDILCIGGGGGGGNGRAGGGGAGGYVYSTSQSLTASSYTVVVGGGGFATSSNGTVGNNSSVSGSGLTTITAGGGGYGGDTGTAGGSGGSGGGGGGNNTGGGSATGVGTGNAGGGGVYNSSYGRSGGGGGGAGSAGASGSSPGSGGAGGTGVQNTAFASATLTGVNGYYAGGGGGGSAVAGATVATGGSGTGGNGGTDSPATVVQSTAGVINTGGGGGGGGGTGSNGGSGVVIIRYAK